MNTQRIAICAVLFSFMLSACEQNDSTTTTQSNQESKQDSMPNSAQSEHEHPATGHSEAGHSATEQHSETEHSATEQHSETEHSEAGHSETGHSEAGHSEAENPATENPATENPAIEKKSVEVSSLPAGHVPVSAQQNAFSNTLNGEVLDTFDASTFTYVQVKTGSGDIWAAGPTTTIRKGDKVSFGGQTPMENFHSTSLNRTFKMIYFANSFAVNQ